ncbi:MAG: DNA-directed RNA polymerase subunit A' [Methanobrevibacter sp.]|nr:DNA-directed RNA polymerase subunit A' [Methanobrevibacter sp.]MBE6489591.1 DNA-directed RNA polymerase subunit A' [Methanobrevibacter sp.]
MTDHYIKKIEQINFGLMSPEDIRKMSVVTVEYPDTYGDDGFPIEKGLMDPRLGIIDPSLVCRTCGFKGGDCQGHFGSIELARPVIHVGFGDVIHKILRSTCNECGRILLNDEQIEYFTTKINEAMENKESINSILKEVYKVAKRELKTMPEDDEEVDLKHCCPHCGAPQEAIILDKPVTIRQGDYKLTPSEVRERLEKITDDDAFVLGVNSEVARPEWLVLTVLPVPPVTVRPSITLDTGERSEDDLTHKLVDILRINQRLLENMEAGAPQLIVEDLWELLQYHVTTYFDNEASGVPPARHRSGRPLKTLTQRLKGKEGRFRSNLSGKRVNFSARTVISPDPNISINEVGVPEMIAKEVTVPVHVNDWNIDEIKGYIENGPDVHPGANYVINGNTKRRVTEETKEFILENIEPGYIVERHLKDGDMVLFNRQPSLHRMSMMAHEVRVLPYKTFRLNLCVCPPYNADFDGDEMNMHVFQTDESRAEAKSLMRVQEHILSPRFGGPIIGAIHDHISGAYLLTRDGVEFTEEEALQIIRKSHLAIPPFKSGQWILKHDPDFGEESYIFKDKGDKWTGKELFSLLLPNDLNLSYSAEISKCPVVYPAEDATVVIKNGILEQGVIDESAYGSFSGKILDKIVKEYGPGRAKEFLDRSTDLAICGIMKTGITTSLNDEEIPEEAQDRINEHLDKKMAEVDKLVESYEEGYLQALPGRSLEETLEMRIMQVLGEARDMSGSIAENYLTMGKQSPDDSYEHVMAVENHSVVMARTGARASMLNLTQITACVGQQAVRGGRIERGYLNRTLPHFKKGELGAKAKGFVHSSYKSGLDPIEFFFHAMGGREGLVDTAIRTAQSGYMQRRLVNALQDLQVKPSGLVTDNQGNVIQTMFGEDGVDPAKSDFGKPADLNKLIDEIKLEMEMEGK